MQHLPQGVKDEEGCFVYEVINENGVDVRSTQDVSDESRTQVSFSPGELVSVDLVSPSRVADSKNGPFLRLSDRSGWLFERKYGEQMMRRVPIQSGLWVVYVDNYPNGQALRKHPVDRSDFKVKNVCYLPMQKIYCDRKVQHRGVNFFRVQGTDGWVFDVRPKQDETKRSMLLEEEKAKTGLFAFRSIGSIGVRIHPDVADKFRSTEAVSDDEIVAVDVIRESVDSSGNGPFLRLIDGSGWLFEYKHNEKVMEEVPVEPGRWVFRVANAPAGIGLRRHPIDSQEYRTGVTYKPGTTVVCDRKITSPSRVNFFRVEGTEGWVFDTRDGDVMMELTQQSSDSMSSVLSATNAKGSEWDPEFVRGVAAACEGVEEIAFNPTSRVISFRTIRDDVRINVYYTTRTIGTALDHPTQGKTQLFRRNCTGKELVTIMNNPRVHTDKGYQRKRARTLSSPRGWLEPGTPRGWLEQEIVVDGEEESRDALMECEEELEKLLQKRQRLLSSIRSYDLKRRDEALRAEKKRMKWKELYDQAVQEELERQAEKKRQEELERRRIQNSTCQECYRVFSSPQACAQHFQAVHCVECDYCGRTFGSDHALYQHRDAVGHW